MNEFDRWERDLIDAQERGRAAGLRFAIEQLRREESFGDGPLPPGAVARSLLVTGPDRFKVALVHPILPDPEPGLVRRSILVDDAGETAFMVRVVDCPTG